MTYPWCYGDYDPDAAPCNPEFCHFAVACAKKKIQNKELISEGQI